MFDCPNCNAGLGHCPNFCDFCGVKIPIELIGRQRIIEDQALAKAAAGGVWISININPVEPCSPATHWMKALGQKHMSELPSLDPGLPRPIILFCSFCGDQLPDVSELSGKEIIETIQFLQNNPPPPQ